MALARGEQVGDLVFVRPNGSTLRLSDVPSAALVLIFLRHLA